MHTTKTLLRRLWYWWDCTRLCR